MYKTSGSVLFWQIRKIIVARISSEMIPEELV
jgi:hypothetical protein